MLMSLLRDPLLMQDIAKLDVDPANPFGPYRSPDGCLGSANSGKWYRHAYQKRVQQPDDFLVPLILAADETTMAKGKKHQC